MLRSSLVHTWLDLSQTTLDSGIRVADSTKVCFAAASGFPRFRWHIAVSSDLTVAQDAKCQHLQTAMPEDFRQNHQAVRHFSQFASGFSLPMPKKLEEIIPLQRLESMTAEEIAKEWNDVSQGSCSCHCSRTLRSCARRSVQPFPFRFPFTDPMPTSTCSVLNSDHACLHRCTLAGRMSARCSPPETS